MACTNCIPISDILDGLRTVDQGCAKKIKRINRILRNFYLSTSGFVSNIVAQPINFIGVGTIQTDFPIYKIMGFFGSGCSDQCYIDQNNKCCGTGTKALKMYRTEQPPKIGQYKLECDTEITANIPKGFSDGYLLYSQGPKIFSGTNEELCIDSVMLSGLEYYMEMFYETVDGEANRIQVSQQRYNERYTKARETQENWVYEVRNGEGTMLW